MYMYAEENCNLLTAMCMCVLFFSFSVGGYDGQSFLDTVECYDPSSAQWSRLQPMTCRRSEYPFMYLKRNLIPMVALFYMHLYPIVFHCVLIRTVHL